MTAATFSICTKFLAKDGVTGVFKNMSGGAAKFGKNVQSNMGKAKAAIMSVKGACVGIIGALTAVGAFVPLKQFADWEKGIMSVYTLMGKNDIEQFGGKLKEISKDAIRMGFAAEDANKGLFDTISALGVSDKSLALYKQSMILAKGGCTELSIAIDGMTSVVNAYGRETTNATKVAESFYTAQQYGKTTVGELASNVGKVAPIAKAAGVSFEELLATMSALTLGGLKTDEATTALRGALSALIKPSKEAEETLQSLGVPYGMLQIRQKGLRYTLEKLNEASKKHPELMASAIPNTRAFTAVMALSGDKLKIIDNIMSDIGKNMTSGNGLMAAFKNMGKTGSATIAQVSGEMTAAMIQLGEVLAPYLLPLIRGFGLLVKKLAELSPKITPIIDGFISAANGVKTLLQYLKPLVVLLPIVTGLFTGFAVYKAVQFLQMMRVQAALFGMVLKSQLIPSILASIPAIWSQTVALLANPIFWIPAAIAAAITAGFLLIKNWDTIKEAFGKVGDWISEKWHSFIENWKIGAGIIKDYFVEKITGLWSAVKTAFTTIGNFIKNHFIDILLGALGPIGLIIQALRKMPQILTKLGFKADGFKIKRADGKDSNTPAVKGGNSKGSIDVDVELTNKTDKNARVSTNLKSPHDMNLNPAN